jgi:hypothetical protein
VVISTSDFTTNDLQQAIRQQFGAISPSRTTLTISSFGFSKGTPPLADLVFDMRFLNNPHWDETLRPMTGETNPWVITSATTPPLTRAFERFSGFCSFCCPRFAAQGKAYVHIAFGCTGGATARCSWPNRSLATCAMPVFHPHCCTATCRPWRQPAGRSPGGTGMTTMPVTTTPMIMGWPENTPRMRMGRF